MRVRVLHAKLYAYALPGSTARQLFNSSTRSTAVDNSSTRSTARQLDSFSTVLDSSTHRHMESASTGSTGSTGKTSTTGSTAPRRSLDSSTARQPGAGLNARPYASTGWSWRREDHVLGVRCRVFACWSASGLTCDARTTLASTYHTLTLSVRGGAPNMCSELVKRGVRTFTPH